MLKEKTESFLWTYNSETTVNNMSLTSIKNILWGPNDYFCGTPQFSEKAVEESLLIKILWFIISRVFWRLHCLKSVQIRSFFWSVFSCIRTEYGLEKTPYLDIFYAVLISIIMCNPLWNLFHIVSFNSSVLNAPFLYLLKTSENFTFADVFSG